MRILSSRSAAQSQHDDGSLSRSHEVVNQSICHDLRNPLDAATRFLKLAARSLAEGRPDRAEELLAGVAVGLHRIDRILAEFDSFRRDGFFPSRLQAVDVVLNECLAMFQEKLTAARCIVVTDVTRPLPPAWAGNLFEVFSNIIQNSLEAMPDGGRLTITARLERPSSLAAGNPDTRCDDKPEEVVIRFADSGPGIARHGADLIFQPHFSTKTQRGGRGLGLAICREIVEQAGGSIAAANRPDGGALVTVRLPAADD